MMELFSFQLSHILKRFLIRSNCLKFHFLYNSPFREKTYNSENGGRKSLSLRMEHFFLKFKIMQWNGGINKEGFLK